MRCPFCGQEDTQVKDSRPTEDNAAIRRRRMCPACASRFTTFERVHVRDLMVVKKDGKQEPFHREKLLRSLKVALSKRPVNDEQIERIANGIQRRMDSMGEVELPSQYIGELVMDALMEIDKVAYVRFASVNRNFREAKDFGDIVGKMGRVQEG